MLHASTIQFSPISSVTDPFCPLSSPPPHFFVAVYIFLSGIIIQEVFMNLFFLTFTSSFTNRTSNAAAAAGMGQGKEMVASAASVSPTAQTVSPTAQTVETATTTRKSNMLAMMLPGLKLSAPVDIPAPAKTISITGEVRTAVRVVLPWSGAVPSTSAVKETDRSKEDAFPPTYKPFPEYSDTVKVVHRGEQPHFDRFSHELEVHVRGQKKRYLVPETELRERYPKAVADYYWRIWLPETPKDVTWPTTTNWSTRAL
ncbi:hypothetical protein BV898_05131 [Hypsibius exemplaris]|uniref:Uncharacterized protein n=1 Tax=Hypsibius exemplaris TaxID=2072580 RepID=A0A1W0X0T8_HYPEX|nr:hypothetical protein BV898_05131 [Hypsibius exemplaris]